MAFWKRKPEKTPAEKAAELKAIRDQRMQIEGQNKLNSSIAMEKKKLQEAKREKFNSSGIGKAFNALGNAADNMAKSQGSKKPHKRKKQRSQSLLGESSFKF